jgi:hypothetical protein
VEKYQGERIVHISKCYLTTLLFVTVFLLGSMRVGAQTLDPEKTVNPATGDMQFSLPLATVKGINGHDFPINLNYQAGIQYHSQASEVGLGFSIGAGSITRKVVYIPDDCPAGDNGMYYGDHPSCATNPLEDFLKWFGLFLMLGMLILAMIAAAYTGGSTVPVIVKTLMTIDIISGMALSAFSMAYMATRPEDYKAGGVHTPNFQYDNDLNGFFAQGTKDVPDIYFVSTPYFSGELVWVGDAAHGHFILKKDEGIGQYSIYYYCEKFVIKLPDGTRLFFDDADSSCNIIEGKSSKVSGGSNCVAWQTTQQRAPVPNVWYLTKVLFPDNTETWYEGWCGGPVKPTKGSWIYFSYKSYDFDWCSKPEIKIQGDEYSLQRFVAGNHDTCVFMSIQKPCGDYFWKPVIREKYLEKIETPNQSAQFEYSDGTRLDDMWWRHRLDDNGNVVEQNTPAFRPELNTIRIKNKDQNTIKKIEFEKDYVLRPNTFNSVAPGKKSLTLLGVKIKAADNTILSRASFQYFTDHNYEGFGRFVQGIPSNGPYMTYEDFRLCIEERDLWGYYCPLNPSAKFILPIPHTEFQLNDFNETGSKARAVAPDGCPYAAAWSLKMASFSNGLSVWWDYEPKIYDMANNDVVGTRYDGGIRVKTVYYNDGIHGDQHISYAYTDKLGEFDETKDGVHSSGHATILPFNPSQSENDYRLQKETRGGLYTPTRIVYEMVQVAKGYTGTGTPYGYSVYTFTTPADEGIQNTGPYGNEDNSWKVGFLKSMAQYGSTGKLVKKMESERLFVPSAISMPTVGDKCIDVNTAGKIYLLKIKTTGDQVVSEQYNKYAFEIADPLAPDYSKETIHAFRFVAWIDNTDYTGNTPAFKSFIASTIDLAQNHTISGEDLSAIYSFTGVQPIYEKTLKLMLYKVASLNNAEYLVTVEKCGPVGCLYCGIGIYENITYEVEHDLDMRPNLVYNMNGDGKLALAKSVPAYSKYTQMKTDGIYAPECEKIAYSGQWDKIVPAPNSFDIDPIVIQPTIVPLTFTSDQLTKIKTGNTLELNFSTTIAPGQPVDKIKIGYKLQVNGDIHALFPAKLREVTKSASNIFIRYPVTETSVSSLALSCNWLIGRLQIKDLQVKIIGDNVVNSMVIGASATTWKKFNETWLPEATYAWTVPLAGAGGLPDANNEFVDFNFAAGVPTNDRWKFKGKVTQYNPFSQPKEAVDPLGKYATNVYGTAISLPSASIANANFYESGAFTCDYNTNEDAVYFDKTNGWETGGAEIVTSAKHFGQACVKAVDCFGPSRNFKIEKGKDYIASAWVASKSIEDGAILCCDYRCGPKNLVFPYPEISGYKDNNHPERIKAITFTGKYQTNAGAWEHLEILINASEDLKNENWNDNDWFVRLFVGTKDKFNVYGTAYIDDIRFYPANAQVSTTYYEPIFDQPIVSVDANGKPGARVSYDRFGRPVTWQKYDPSNHFILKTVKTQNYHLMGE